MKPPQDDIANHGIPTSPASFLQQAVKSVPAVKWAIGIAGIVAAIAVIQGFKIDFRIAVFGSIIMLVLMSVLVVFAKLAAERKSHFAVPALTFAWFSLILTMATAVALFLSVFADWPLPLRDIVRAPIRPEIQQQTVTIPDAPQKNLPLPVQEPSELEKLRTLHKVSPIRAEESGKTLDDDVVREAGIAKTLHRSDSSSPIDRADPNPAPVPK